MPLNLFYTMVQKSQKWPKTQIKGGPALKAGVTSGDWGGIKLQQWKRTLARNRVDWKRWNGRSVEE